MKVIIAAIGVGAMVMALYLFSPERVEYTAPEREPEVEEVVDALEAAALQLQALKQELNTEEAAIEEEIAQVTAEYEAMVAELTATHASTTAALEARKDEINNLRQSFQ